MKDVKWIALTCGAVFTLYTVQGFARLESALNAFGDTIWSWDFFYNNPVRMVIIPVAGLILLTAAAVSFLRSRGADS